MKNVTVCLEHRFFEYKGEIYTKLSFPYSYWKDYLNYFDKVTIVARVREVESIDSNYIVVSGPNVDYIKFPYYVGPKQFLKSLLSLLKCSIYVAKSGSHFLLRSGNVTNLVWPFLIVFKKPFIREYPGNIEEGIKGLTGGGFLNSLMAKISHAIAKIQSKTSLANSYVSRYCSQLYPSKAKSFIFSSFNSDEITIRKRASFNSKRLRIVSVGRLEGEKGHEDLIRSLYNVQLDIELYIIGDGRKKAVLEQISEDLGINVSFLGTLTDRQQLFDELMSADLFVIPSHTEGMPRSLLEAMALGLPCLGTSVGGIPEVLDENMLFEPKNPDSCSSKLIEVLSDTKLLHDQASRNYHFIQSNYSKSVLDRRKQSFWSELYR